MSKEITLRCVSVDRKRRSRKDSKKTTSIRSNVSINGLNDKRMKSVTPERRHSRSDSRRSRSGSRRSRSGSRRRCIKYEEIKVAASPKAASVSCPKADCKCDAPLMHYAAIAITCILLTYFFMTIMETPSGAPAPSGRSYRS